MGKQYIQILDLKSDDVKIKGVGDPKFIITIYGKTKENKNIILNITEFEPYFYVRIPSSEEYNWNQSTFEMFFKNNKKYKFTGPNTNNVTVYYKSPKKKKEGEDEDEDDQIMT